MGVSIDLETVEKAKQLVVADFHYDQIDIIARSDRGVELAKEILESVGESITPEEHERICDDLGINYEFPPAILTG